MGKIEDMALLVEIVDAGGLSAAGRRLARRDRGARPPGGPRADHPLPHASAGRRRAGPDRCGHPAGWPQRRP